MDESDAFDVAFVAEVHKLRKVGAPIGCCDEWPECSHALRWVESLDESVSPEQDAEIRQVPIEDLLIAVATPDWYEDSPSRKAAWDEIKRRAEEASRKEAKP